MRFHLLVRSMLTVVMLSGCMAPYAPKAGAPVASVTFVNHGYTPVDMYHEACGVYQESTRLASLRRGESTMQHVTAGEPFSFTFYARVAEDWSCSLGYLTFTPVAGERYEVEFTQTGAGPPARCSVDVSRIDAFGAKVREPVSDCRVKP